MVLEAVCSLLEDEFTVVGGVNDVSTLRSDVERLKPDVVVIDVSTPFDRRSGHAEQRHEAWSGFDSVRWLRAAMPTVRMVVLSANEDPRLAAAGFRLGVMGWVLKSGSTGELSEAVRQAAQNRRFLTRRIANGDFAGLPIPPEIATADPLTPRAREVLALLVAGKSTKEVAAILGITRRTVAFHKCRMMELLGVRTSAELLKFALTSRVV
jgi:DNA-binding NarL/FixJ family response regulator